MEAAASLDGRSSAVAADAVSVAPALMVECARAAAGLEMRRRDPEPKAGVTQIWALRLDSP
jgi:hypothetical protein